MSTIASWQRKLGAHAVAAAALLCAGTAGRAQTAAGTAITNRAEVRYAVDGAARQALSNAVTFVVAERLDVGLSGDGAPVTVTPQPVAVPATITNMGSGDEAFAVAATVGSGLRVDLVAIDRDGDGRYDAAVDQRLAGTTPVLAPGETVRLVAVVAPTAAPVDGTLTIVATAATGSGEVDRVLPGLGDGGGDAVIGRTGARASAARPLVAAADAPGLVKRQSVRAPDGSDRAVRGAIVTYTLVATLPPGAARDPRIEDPVPAGTSYVANSLTLDGAPLSDAADDDPGDCDGRVVAVALGAPSTTGPTTSPATRTVTFQVRLP